MKPMTRQYRFCCLAIQPGRTVLIYKGVTDPKPVQVRDASRLWMAGLNMTLDGQSVRGYTVSVKPYEGEMNEDERRGYKKVRITDSLSGWPNGSIAWLDTESEDRDECYNADCSDYWYHRLGSECEFVDDQGMKLEVGKFYKTRDGRKAKVIEYNEANVSPFYVSYVGENMRLFYSSDGITNIWDRNDDLISEWPTETGTLAELNVKPGDVVGLVCEGNNKIGYSYPSTWEHCKVSKDGRIQGISQEYCDATWRIISRAEEYQPTEDELIRAADAKGMDCSSPASPVRTVTRTEVVPGVYGRFAVDTCADDRMVLIGIERSHMDGDKVKHGTIMQRMSADDLTAAITTLTAIRDALRD